jgi:hypothetical protein
VFTVTTVTVLIVAPKKVSYNHHLGRGVGVRVSLALLNTRLLSFKGCCITDELGGTEHDTLWFDCCDLESDLQEFVGWGCERGLTGGGASQQLTGFHLNREVLCLTVDTSYYTCPKTYY